MKRPSRRKSNYQKIFFEDAICVYCGMPWEEEDHALPYSQRHLGEGRYIVPACHECNILLSNSVQTTLEQRIESAKARLRTHHARLLALPLWSNDELGEMSPEFRNEILRRLAPQKLVRDRLAFDFFRWRELGRPFALLPQL